MWQNDQMADVRLTLEFGTPPSGGGDAEDAGKRTNRFLLENTRHYLLHSQVLASNSLFFRASFTTGVGAASRPPSNPGSESYRYNPKGKMSPSMMDAVDCVLKHFYFHKEHAVDTSSALLLRIMKVGLALDKF